MFFLLKKKIIRWIKINLKFKSIKNNMEAYVLMIFFIFMRIWLLDEVGLK